MEELPNEGKETNQEDVQSNSPLRQASREEILSKDPKEIPQT
jgi:hypothetical protein